MRTRVYGVEGLQSTPRLDLVDLVLIAQAARLDATELRRALGAPSTVRNFLMKFTRREWWRAQASDRRPGVARHVPDTRRCQGTAGRCGGRQGR